MVPVSWQMGALSFLASPIFCDTSSSARSALDPDCSSARCSSMTLVTSGGKKAEVRRISSRMAAWNLVALMLAPWEREEDRFIVGGAEMGNKGRRKSLFDPVRAAGPM